MEMNSTGLFLVGRQHTIEFTAGEEGVTAKCRGAQADFQHGVNWCPWSESYYSLGDATEHAADHADKGWTGR